MKIPLKILIINTITTETVVESEKDGGADQIVITETQETSMLDMFKDETINIKQVVY